jgi:predicted metal-dependent hydrolase
MARRELVSRDLRRLALGGEHLDYVLLRRRGRRGVGLKVDETGLTVSAPVTMPLARVEALVRESERWILRKVREWSARQVPDVGWCDGTLLPFLGSALTLRLVPGPSRVERLGDELVVRVRQPTSAELVKRAVVAWYKRAAASHFGERVPALARAAGIAPPRLLLSSATARWGSCNTDREVRLAWRLVKAPAELVDYVICHELAHLRHMNHSRAFWAEVERQCPAYRGLRARLFATDFLYRSF